MQSLTLILEPPWNIDIWSKVPNMLPTRSTPSWTNLDAWPKEWQQGKNEQTPSFSSNMIKYQLTGARTSPMAAPYLWTIDHRRKNPIVPNRRLVGIWSTIQEMWPHPQQIRPRPKNSSSTAPYPHHSRQNTCVATLKTFFSVPPWLAMNTGSRGWMWRTLWQH